MTFVLPLPGVDGSVTPERRSYSLDNHYDLVNYINNSYAVQQQLEIDNYLCSGVWETVMGHYVVVADLSDVTIGEAIGKPHIDIAMQSAWGKYVPTEEEWNQYREFVKDRLCSIINGAADERLLPKDITFSVRRKTSKAAKVFLVYRHS